MPQRKPYKAWSFEQKIAAISAATAIGIAIVSGGWAMFTYFDEPKQKAAIEARKQADPPVTAPGKSAGNGPPSQTIVTNSGNNSAVIVGANVGDVTVNE